MFTIQVFSEATGRAVSGQKVGVSIGAFDGVKYEYTDAHGQAHFDYPTQSDSEVYIDGKIVHSGQVGGRIVVYV
nr:hypothetical protein Hi04_10k_c2089_00015 [uncultured bacterium]